MPKINAELSAAEPPPRGNILSPLVALLVHPDEKATARFREVFEDVACDWRLVRAADGTAAARQVMSKGLPDLLVVCPDLPQVSGAELIQWLRSFRGAGPIPVLVYGEPSGPEAREPFLRNDVRFFADADSSRQVLAARLTDLVEQVEKRRFALPS